MTALAEFVDVTFKNQTVTLDGKRFVRCTFEDCLLIYGGGVVETRGSRLSGCDWQLVGVAGEIAHALQMLQWELKPPQRRELKIVRSAGPGV